MKNELLIHWLLLIVVKIAQVIIIPVIISPNNLGALLHNYNFFWSKKKNQTNITNLKFCRGLVSSVVGTFCPSSSALFSVLDPTG